MVHLALSAQENLNINDPVTLPCGAGRNLRARGEASPYQMSGLPRPPSELSIFLSSVLRS